ncbi:Mitogen-activated protein kinase kinase kinase 20 [Cardamine amara subsp. amara]|uniref:Mitogen-activated protein kinase kinase kinase 20 n=1 Tax=Cardamine amara subsp. amara TaxID=228776 RepID=A0ABD1AJF5_CARAN
MDRRPYTRRKRLSRANQWRQISPEMEFVKVIGKGSYGSVELFGNKQNDGSMFYTAVKITDSKDYSSIDREFRILSELRGCPRIVQLYGKSLVQGTNCNKTKVYKMSMEYAASGNLTNFIKLNRNRLSDSIIKDFTRMILQGLVSIHSHGYVHCDLKPDNLLLFPVYDKETWDCSYDLKISDFGLTTKAGDESDCWEITAPWVGTPVYMPPESVKDGTVEKTLDLWSLGCIVLEMYTSKRPWFGVDLDDDVKTILLDNKSPEIPNTVPCDARQFLEKCFARKPEERGSASELLLHPFLIGGRKMVAFAGGERTGMVLRIRKPPMISKDDIPKKPLKLKIISQKPLKVQKLSNEPLRL